MNALIHRIGFAGPCQRLGAHKAQGVRSIAFHEAPSDERVDPAETMTRLSTVLVTGATGFIGTALTPHLEADARYAVHPLEQSVWQAGRLPAPTEGAVLVHLAGRAHRPTRDASDEETERTFLRENAVATANLARVAATMGVRRFVFMSSIKALGESTEHRSPFQPSDVPAPEDAYGRSKLAAEHALAEIGRETGMEIVIVRPPLVYGPGVKGNLASLLTWMQRGYPLPLGALPDAPRSMVNVRNLVDLLVTLIDHPAAAGRTFHVRDDEDVTTRALLLRLYAALGRARRLVPVPLSLLRPATRLVGRAGMLERLTTPLQVDDSMTRTRIGWSPRWTLDEGIHDMVAAHAPQGDGHA